MSFKVFCTRLEKVGVLWVYNFHQHFREEEGNNKQTNHQWFEYKLQMEEVLIFWLLLKTDQLWSLKSQFLNNTKEWIPKQKQV